MMLASQVDQAQLCIWDPRSGLLHVWFGPASCDVHVYTPDGDEITVWADPALRARRNIWTVGEVRHAIQDRIRSEITVP